MKIIKKFANLIRHLSICIILLGIIGCRKEETNKNIEKRENLGLRGAVNNRQSEILKSNKWKLRRYKVSDQINGTVVYEKNVENKIISFNEKNIIINNKISGRVDYKNNRFIINEIDTLTNEFYLLHLRNGQLILRNDIYFTKEKKNIKLFKIELNLSTDTLKSNKDFYKIEY
ncbi:hypothetical protein NAL32_19785 [Chryseobacterium sp. Ch-15]|uniref:Uncharacterized protein n=1 Tax=Chryseobacterium muglaense TaxID=2893752 RepID=A0A9Q3YVP7_9FLAO|nr:hypothetical protein [Chryseobacterium muglaense]MBD3906419.1 hypothetical protein [Chryseobacterium muglaense]MCC9037072.1 hypothetical protein [Chryseobacterium muglaense]MCM2556637.1 hypothetical protein [Chryseobacterium muglaense]